jgi:hypothetical protein
MATTVEDANRMIEVSKKANKLLYIGFQKRLVPITFKMHDLAVAGEIGKIQMVSGHLFRGDWNPRSWKYTEPENRRLHQLAIPDPHRGQRPTGRWHSRNRLPELDDRWARGEGHGVGRQ